MKFKGDIIITDPCYIDTPDDKLWDGGEVDIFSGSGLNKFGFTNYIWRDTIYGDWSCTTFKVGSDPKKLKMLKAKLDEMYANCFQKINHPDTKNEDKQKIYKEYSEERKKIEDESGMILGHFCADAGLVGVFLLDEVLKFNPSFDYHINNPHSCTWIKDFDGEITDEVVSLNPPEDEDDEDYYETEEVRIVGKGNINFYTSQTGL